MIDKYVYSLTRNMSYGEPQKFTTAEIVTDNRFAGGAWIGEEVNTFDITTPLGTPLTEEAITKDPNPRTQGNFAVSQYTRNFTGTLSNGLKYEVKVSFADLKYVENDISCDLTNAKFSVVYAGYETVSEYDWTDEESGEEYVVREIRQRSFIEFDIQHGDRLVTHFVSVRVSPCQGLDPDRVMAAFPPRR